MSHKIIPYANSIFEQPWWLDIVAPGNWDEVVVKDNDEIIARLPYVLDHSKICMPQWTQTLGIWMKEEIRSYKRGNSQNIRQKEIIINLLNQLPKHKSLNIRMDSSNSYILPFRWLGYKYNPTFSYRISFDTIDKKENISQIYSKHLNRDIKAARKKINIKESTDINQILTLRELTYKRQNRKDPENRDNTYKIIEKILQQKAGRLIYGVDDNDVIYNGVFCIYDETSCYYLMAYNHPEYQSSGTMCLLTNNCIEFAYDHSSFFDFEGSNVEGIEHYFRGYGGELVTNYTILKQSFLKDCLDVAKPRIKRLIGYRI